MTVVAILAYYLFAFGFIGAVVLVTVRQIHRRAAVMAARDTADYQTWAYTPLMPEPLPDAPDHPAPPELTADALEEFRQMIEPILDRISQDSPDPATAHRRVRSLTDRLRAAVQSEMSSL